MADKKLDFKIVVKDGFSSGFKKFASGLKSIGKNLFSFKTALVGVAGVAGVGFFIKKTLNAIDEVSKLSRVLGLTVSELQQLKFIGELSGVTVDTLGRSIRTLSKVVNDFANKGLQSYAASFRTLGISAQDLRDVQHDQLALFTLVGSRLNKLENGFQKNAIAQELFGGRASQVLLVLEDGIDRFEELRKEADELGLTMTKDTAKGVENANDSILRLKSLADGLRYQFVAALAPAISAFVDLIKNGLKASIEETGGSVEEFSKMLAVSTLQTIKAVVIGFENLTNAIIASSNRIAGYIDLAQAFAMAGLAPARSLRNLKEAYDNFNESVTKKPVDFSSAISALDGFVEKIKTSVGEGTDPFANLRENAIVVTGHMTALQKAFAPILRGIDDIGAGAKAGFAKFGDSIKPLKMAIEDISARGLDRATDALAALVMGTKTAKEAFREFALSIVSDLTKMIIKQMLFNAISGFFGGFGGGANAGGGATAAASPTASNLNAKFGIAPISVSGARADGGNVQRGRTYMVGERGVELFTPNQSGAIVPNNAIGGNGVVVNQTINVSTGVAQTVRTEIAQLMPDIARASKNAVLDARRRGGTFADAFGG